MKKAVLIPFCLLFLLSCADNPVTKKMKEVKEQVSNSQSVLEEASDMQDDIKELTETTPLTNEELKAWLPEDMAGMKRTSFKTGAMGMMKIASIEATYATEDKEKSIKIEVIDGAGEMGAFATASLRMVLSQEFEEETEYSSRKTITRKGTKAIEEYKKDTNQSEIQFMKDRRFYIKATGEGMEIDELWQLIDELDVDDLG